MDHRVDAGHGPVQRVGVRKVTHDGVDRGVGRVRERRPVECPQREPPGQVGQQRALPTRPAAPVTSTVGRAWSIGPS